VLFDSRSGTVPDAEVGSVPLGGIGIRSLGGVFIASCRNTLTADAVLSVMAIFRQLTQSLRL